MPMNRAMLSDHRPNASGSNRGSVIRPRLARLVEAHGPARLSHCGRPGGHGRHLRRVAVAPVARQQVVEHVVDGDRADQPVVLVDDRHRHQVVGRHPLG